MIVTSSMLPLFIPTWCLSSSFFESLRIIIAVVLKESSDLYNYGDELNGWWVLAQKLNPFAKQANIPNMSEVGGFMELAMHCVVT